MAPGSLAERGAATANSCRDTWFTVLLKLQAVDVEDVGRVKASERDHDSRGSVRYVASAAKPRLIRSHYCRTG